MNNAWLPLFAPLTQTPPQHFFTKFRDYIPHSPRRRTPLQGSDYITAISEMSDSASAMDGWKLAHLALLHPHFWDARAVIDRYTETHGVMCDESIRNINSPCLEKPGLATPRNKRILGVMAMNHRVYMRANYTSYLSPWQGDWATSDLLGGRPRREAVEGAFAFAIDRDKAKNASGLAAAFIDVAKFFDSIPRNTAWLLLIYMGMDRHLIRYMRTIYSHISRHLKLNGTFGAVVIQSRGFVPGCTFSIIVANAVMMV